jgi:hypothetical protein
MKCQADIHYEVIRRPPKYGDVVGLACKFCTFYVRKSDVPQPRTSRSGLGRYNRLRARMIRHLHKEHRDKLEEQPR